jgi:hypothetical protein
LNADPPVMIGDRVWVVYGNPHPGRMRGVVKGILVDTRMAYVEFDIGGLPEWVSFDRMRRAGS